jgi:hypothetical protein
VNIVKEKKKRPHKIKRRKTDWICSILHKNCLLKKGTAGKGRDEEKEKEDVSIYWMILRKREDHGSLQRNH